MAAPHSNSCAVAREPMVSTRVLRELIAAVERAGVSRERFLEAAKLDPEWLEAEEGRLLRSDVLACCEIAIEITGDPALGLHWAERVTSNSFNLMPQLLAHASTLRQALDTLFQFAELLTDRLNMRRVEHGEHIELHVVLSSHDSSRNQRLTAEMTLLGMFRMLRDLCPDARFERVSFAYPAPDYHAEYARVFEGSVQFDQPFTGIAFDRALLDVPTPHKDEDIEKSLRALAERRISLIREHTPYALRVRSFLMQQGAPHRVTVKTVAQWLALSSRSLHRRLAEEGQSYAVIASEASAIVAKRLLSGERRTIQETAFAMGFADVSSFHRAFKRWTGSTPTRFRIR